MPAGAPVANTCGMSLLSLRAKQSFLYVLGAFLTDTFYAFNVKLPSYRRGIATSA